jgi:hypothetical protein
LISAGVWIGRGRHGARPRAPRLSARLVVRRVYATAVECAIKFIVK